jgi:hypothetical protein
LEWPRQPLELRYVTYSLLMFIKITKRLSIAPICIEPRLCNMCISEVATVMREKYGYAADLVYIHTYIHTCIHTYIWGWWFGSAWLKWHFVLSHPLYHHVSWFVEEQCSLFVARKFMVYPFMFLNMTYIHGIMIRVYAI